nr:MFS transporter [Leifsonia xyli]
MTANDFRMVLVAGMTLLSWRSAVTSQLFAVLAEIVSESDSIMVIVTPTVRGGYALGYAIGPLIGAALAGAFGARTALVAAAVGNLLVLIPFLLVRRVRRGGGPSTTSLRDTRARLGGRLWVLVVVVLFVCAGDTPKLVFLPVHVEQSLGGNAWTVASLFSVSAIAEIVLFPLSGIVAARWGTTPTIVMLGLARTRTHD